MFQMPVIEVPTNLPNIRNDLPIQAFAVGCTTLTVNIIWVFYFQVEVILLNFTCGVLCIVLDGSGEMGTCSSRS